MRDQIVLPGKIVKALAHKAAVGFEIIFGVFVLLTGADNKRPRFIGLEIGLENHNVGFVQFVKVRIHRLGEQFLAG